MNKSQFKTTTVSSLAKVFPDEDLIDSSIQWGSALWNEIYSFQVAYLNNGPLQKGIKAEIESPLAKNTSVRSVGLVRSDFPNYHNHDDQILRSIPGLYPNPLYTISDEGLTTYPN